MSVRTAKIMDQSCADMDTHRAHQWGWPQRKCPGAIEGVSMTPNVVEKLAALHHDSLIQALLEQGLASKTTWRQLPPASRQARVQAMRQVLLDLQELRK